MKFFGILRDLLKAVLPIFRKDKLVEDWVILVLEIALAIAIVLA